MHHQAGTSVTYVTADGVTRPHRPNRYLQALKRATNGGLGLCRRGTYTLLAIPGTSSADFVRANGVEAPFRVRR